MALATAVFLTSLTETLPAGLLPEMSEGLGVTESATGQTVTIYAVGTALTAIPLTAATAGWRRKRLLLVAMGAFGVANTVTALSSNYPLTLVARFVAGVAAGLAWALLAGYARRMVPVHLQGKAVAVAMAGIPVALSLGVPVGTFVGKAVGWRTAFMLMTGLTLILLAWITAVLPDYPGRRPQDDRPPANPPTPTPAPSPESPPAPSPSMFRALTTPGIRPVLFVTLVFVLAHTILYAYVAAFLDRVGMSGSTDLVLLDFGGASLLGIWCVGAHIDRRLRVLTVGSTLLVGTGAAALAIPADNHALVYVAVLLWGLGWGGVPTLLQTAVAQAGGESADAAQAALVTLWNAAMAAGGVIGGVLLDSLGARSFPWAVLVLMVPTLAVVLAARGHAFPGRKREPATA
ncbi:MFS transporter [Streptomyces sp. NA04227]|uniref:MFS transporter n=1 Tax=Streptomyces sp. NA04227 TaxID=2742136 RepID=UPI001590B653|nr:MFS transporter [Streptomyces sp. NA04227]QKW10870.1 MFS transporter [Streptomyces sp. NA04227]